MVSDGELVDRLRSFLRASDLNTTTTTGAVRRQLEADFNVDLSEKKAFIREQVDLFLSELENEKKEEEEKEEENDEEENGVKEEEEEEEEEDEEDEEEEEERSNGGRSRKRSRSNKEVKKRGGGGFAKVCSLSPQLQEFLGETELARTEVVKRIWAYIRENSLQDPSNRRKILCDERMHNLFNVKSIDMFQMNKALSKHIWPLDSEDGTSKSAQKEKKPKKEREDESPPKEKKQKGGRGFLAPLQLSDALVKFIGTGESELPRSDVVKRMWDYIKQNNLQDPADKKTVICDEKLKELFQVDSFTGFTVPKLLTAHFIKTK
ncbi:upstream activation factor subunit spp27-like isoform X2 [Asparagus officinalis]|uniref:upstream activation factor subunit spp27-like isoform X2 n=1 Tax=Asparagus officinalis TaxID=4686 RepID=UPI00098E0BE1|nr:upstream activation factor subunit spp27-like isoform X2 [Asparagus officinalis]